MRVTIKTIATLVAAETGVCLHDFAPSTGHDALEVRARWLTGWLARKTGERSYPQIASAFGLDHTTMLSGLRKFDVMVLEPQWVEITTRLLELILALQRDEPDALAAFALAHRPAPLLMWVRYNAFCLVCGFPSKVQRRKPDGEAAFTMHKIHAATCNPINGAMPVEARNSLAAEERQAS